MIALILLSTIGRVLLLPVFAVFPPLLLGVHYTANKNLAIQEAYARMPAVWTKCRFGSCMTLVRLTQ
jgi:hypothetical protein